MSTPSKERTASYTRNNKQKQNEEWLNVQKNFS